MSRAENPSRDRILSRIRSALCKPALPATPSQPAPPKTIFPPITDALDRFQKECAINITECFVTPDMPATAAAMKDVLSALPSGEVFVQDSPELRRVALQFSSDRPIWWSSEGPPEESSQATISACEALVAQTGSVLVSAVCGGRGASVVAPVHIVVATADQLVPDLDSALAHVQSRGIVSANSYLCLITGSSRTADIEKILVMGAHGPRRLIVFLALA
jgi:L-lactate dehydrogenase complex protein LldG